MSHGKSYSRGVSFYGLGYQEDESARAAETSLLNFPSRFPSRHQGMSSKTPWSSVQSGYSSASPPGTASSGSSANSQCYGRSPDDLSVDSLISSLLQVVNSENFGTCGPCGDSRPQCANGTLPSSRCRDCTDTPCDSCITMHQASRLTSSHGMEQHCNTQHSAPMEIPSPPMPHVPDSPPNTAPLYCDIHRDAQRFYCQTCSRPLCGDCGTHLHHGHVTIHLMEAVEGAGTQANQVLSEAKLGITALREDLDAVQMAAESLEQKARQATADVMLCVRRVASALEAREKELLGRIEKARVLKFAALKARDEGLRNGIARLSRAVDKLGDAMESSTLACNPLDLLLTKDMASAEVFQIRQTRQSLPPPEENWISFTGPEGAVLHAIANLGSIVVNNPGPIGDRRAVRGRGSSPQTPYQIQSQAQVIPLSPVPRGRPVPSNAFPVTVRTGRNHPGTISKPVKVIGNDGDARDNLCRPWGVACDKEGHIIVADRSNNRIQIYRQDGTFVRRFGTHGTGPCQFDRPAGVAVDGRRRIVVADKDNHRIQVLTMEGLFLLSFGEKGSKCGQFNYPWDVAVNSECQIVVSDTRNHRIQLFSPEGIFLRKYGFETTPGMWKHFDSPRGVAFNPEGNVVTTDFNNHRVIVIDADFLNARLFGYEGNGGGTKQFLRPQGLVIDDEGNIAIADSRNHRIQVFDSAGTLKWKFGSYGKGPDEMDRPSGIALTPDGRIAVVDFGNNRVLLL